MELRPTIEFYLNSNRELIFTSANLGSRTITIPNVSINYTNEMKLYSQNNIYIYIQDIIFEGLTLFPDRYE